MTETNDVTYVVKIAQAMAALTPAEQRTVSMLVYAYITGLKEAKEDRGEQD